MEWRSQEPLHSVSITSFACLTSPQLIFISTYYYSNKTADLAWQIMASTLPLTSGFCPGILWHCGVRCLQGPFQLAGIGKPRNKRVAALHGSNRQMLPFFHHLGGEFWSSQRVPVGKPQSPTVVISSIAQPDIDLPFIPIFLFPDHRLFSLESYPNINNLPINILSLDLLSGIT